MSVDAVVESANILRRMGDFCAQASVDRAKGPPLGPQILSNQAKALASEMSRTDRFFRWIKGHILGHVTCYGQEVPVSRWSSIPSDKQIVQNLFIKAKHCFSPSRVGEDETVREVFSLVLACDEGECKDLLQKEVLSEIKQADFKALASICQNPVCMNDGYDRSTFVAPIVKRVNELAKTAKELTPVQEKEILEIYARLLSLRINAFANEHGGKPIEYDPKKDPEVNKLMVPTFLKKAIESQNLSCFLLMAALQSVEKMEESVDKLISEVEGLNKPYVALFILTYFKNTLLCCVQDKSFREKVDIKIDPAIECCKMKAKLRQGDKICSVAWATITFIGVVYQPSSVFSQFYSFASPLFSGGRGFVGGMAAGEGLSRSLVRGVVAASAEAVFQFIQPGIVGAAEQVGRAGVSVAKSAGAGEKAQQAVGMASEALCAAGLYLAARASIGLGQQKVMAYLNEPPMPKPTTEKEIPFGGQVASQVAAAKSQERVPSPTYDRPAGPQTKEEWRKGRKITKQTVGKS